MKKTLEAQIQKFAGQRMKMVEEQLLGRDIKDLRVLDAMSRIPRHLFVAEALEHRAYGDHPLPIGENQTISQPYTVGRMSELLELTGHERVLEIGTGSGYQTAVLAELADKVFTIERIRAISVAARERLQRLGYLNIIYHVFDGSYGWKDQGPYDAILITASLPEIPRTLVEQLKDKGRIAAPVGHQAEQTLSVLTREGKQTVQKDYSPCRFVNLVGKHGWSRGG